MDWEIIGRLILIGFFVGRLILIGLFASAALASAITAVGDQRGRARRASGVNIWLFGFFFAGLIWQCIELVGVLLG